MLRRPAVRAPRLLLVQERMTIGSTLLSLPAIRAAQRHLGPGVETWFLYRSSKEGEPAALELLRTLPLAGVMALPRSPGPLTCLALAWRLWRLRLTAAAFFDLPVAQPRVLRRYSLLLRAIGLPRLIGFAPMAGPDFAASAPLPSIALLRLQHLARAGVDVSVESSLPPPPLALPPEAVHHARIWLQQQRRHPARALLAICPGARSAANRWPEQRFVELGQLALQHGEYELLVCGGAEDQALGQRLVQAWGEGINAAGRFSLLETAALLQAADLMVGLDTGTTHLAAAVGTPCLMLQGGRTRRGLWQALGHQVRVLRHEVECGGCGLTQCPLSRHPCMRGLGSAQAWQALQQLRHSVQTEMQVRA